MTATLGVELSSNQVDQFQQYKLGLEAWNQRVNLTSQKALEKIEQVHFLDSLSLVPVLRHWAPDAQRLVDVGAGAGFPGVPIKLALPHLQLVLVEATQKKADFLVWLVGELGLDEVEVVVQRVEGTARLPQYRESFDVVTARALGPLPVALELTLPLGKVGGVVVIPQRGEVASEVGRSTLVLDELGGGLTAVEPLSTDGLPLDSVAVVVKKERPTPERYPRRVGVPSKRPLATAS
jgi:16S rRNA (guanine527-N7)-methyltransferase